MSVQKNRIRRMDEKRTWPRPTAVGGNVSLKTQCSEILEMSVLTSIILANVICKWFHIFEKGTVAHFVFLLTLRPGSKPVSHNGDLGAKSAGTWTSATAAVASKNWFVWQKQRTISALFSFIWISFSSSVLNAFRDVRPAETKRPFQLSQKLLELKTSKFRT